MNRITARIAAVSATVTVAMFALASAAGATTTVPDAQQVVGTAASDLRDQLLNIAGTVLPYAVGILAMTLGWRLARKFIRA